MNRKVLLLGLVSACTAAIPAGACTGIALTAKDGSYIQARTIEWAKGYLESGYSIIPRGEKLFSYTPDGGQGMHFTAKYGVVGLTVADKNFIAEGINEAGLSCGLFFFPGGYGSYKAFDPARRELAVADMQFNQFILARYSTINEVKDALLGGKVDVVGLVGDAVLHWRIGEPSGREVVLEIVDGVPHFYENPVGVITNAPGFEWHLTNLSNYVNLYGGNVSPWKMDSFEVRPVGSGSGLLGLPGDATPPSRFVRAAFIRNTAPQLADAFATVTQTFHLLNSFDIPLGFETNVGTEFPNIPSATQWTSSIDLTHRKVYYHTAYNVNIRCIDLEEIDFGKVAYQWHPLDASQVQPVEMVKVK